MWINTTLKIGRKILAQAQKAYVKVIHRATSFESFGLKMKQLTSDIFECSDSIKPRFNKQITMLTKEQRASINAYTQAVGFENLNYWLRQPRNLNIKNWKEVLAHRNMLYHISNIDDGLRILKAPCDFTTYRGIDHLTLDDIVKLKGKNLTDLAYGSSSLSQEVAENYGDIVFRINIKKGMNCGYIDVISDFKHVEDEVLLPRGYTIKIGDIKPYKNSKGKTKYLVEAELQPMSKPKPIKTYYDSLNLGKYPEFDFLSDIEQAHLDLSHKQLLAIKNVKNINKYLQNPNTKKTIRTLSKDGTTITEIPIQEIMESRISSIDSVLQSVKSSEVRTVYLNESELLSNCLNANIGESFVNKGYTICQATINGNSSTLPQKVYKLELPQGTSFYFDKQSGNIILPRDIKYKITNISTNGNREIKICS